MFKGYIFDLDGVITDTAEYHYRAWKRLAEELGIPFSREDNEALRGVPRRPSLELMLKGRTYPEEILLELMERKNGYYIDFIQQITPEDLLPGVEIFLTETKAKGVLLGIGSSSKNALTVCKRLGIMPLLDALGDGFSVVNHKPAPDLFIWVAGRLNLTPSECLVFEDAEAGVEAALAGGFKVIGIGPQERVGQAHYVRANLDGMTIAEITAHLPE
jgi:beta-phosphoglucomutase